jgi:hypothetical protein
MSEKDYIDAIFSITYGKPIMKIFTFMTGFAVVSAVPMMFLYPKSFSLTQMAFPFLFFVVLPLVVYASAKRDFKTNSRFSETICYRFYEDNLEMVGESFNSTFSWEKVFKVTQTKKMVFIWQNAQVSNPIPKRDIWEGDLAELKTF